LDREGYSPNGANDGATYISCLRQLLKTGANLADPEDVKAKIAAKPWNKAGKRLACYAYGAFCTMEKISWTMPKYTPDDAQIYVPDEKDLDTLIHAAKSKMMAAFLQTLKETFADPTEILRLEWIDFREKEQIITINHPVKNHLSGHVQITPRLVGMLNGLPKNNVRIFPRTYRNMYGCLALLRKNASEKLQNPRLLRISFKSFRHWGGSMLAHYTQGNLLIIQKALRHRCILNTMKYIHTIPIKDEDFEIAVATTPEEIKQYGKAGWVKYDEMTFNGTQMHFYKKPKRFGGLVNNN
jgi:integrase